MTMTDNEIRRNYEGAKNKKMQIGILADLNCCTRAEIRAVLGLAKPEKKETKEPPPTENEIKEIAPPEEKKGDIFVWLGNKLDGIEEQIESYNARIKELEQQYSDCVATLRVLSEYEETGYGNI